MKIIEGVKPCTLCRIVKPFECFSKDAQKRDLMCSQCKACQRRRQAVYNAANMESARKTTRDWARRNREALVRRELERRKNSPAVRASHNFSTRVRKCLRGAKGGRSWVDLVDYTPGELIAHLERQFLKGMNWGNMGEWHIDHIVPLASFCIQSSGDDEFRRAWSLSNLRPIWAAENLRKGHRRELLV